MMTHVAVLCRQRLRRPGGCALSRGYAQQQQGACCSRVEGLSAAPCAITGIDIYLVNHLQFILS